MSPLEILLALMVYFCLPFIFGGILRRRSHGPLILEMILASYAVTMAVFARLNWLVTRFQLDVFLIGFLVIVAMMFVGKHARIGGTRRIRISMLDLFLIAVIFASVAEEIVFRGMIQNLLNLYIPWSVLGLKWGTILASLAFTFFHAANVFARFETLMEFVLAIPTRFVLSIIIGYAYQRSNALVVPIALHAIINFIIFLGFQKNRERST